MMMNKDFSLFAIRLIIVLAVTFGIHLLLLDYFKLPLFDHLIVLAYSINTFLALVIYFLLTNLPERLNPSAGFIFLGGSLFKFILFFIVFNPEYKADGEIERLEFFAFFTSYGVSLFLETFSLVRRLNRQ